MDGAREHLAGILPNVKYPSDVSVVRPNDTVSTKHIYQREHIAQSTISGSHSGELNATMSLIGPNVHLYWVFRLRYSEGSTHYVPQRNTIQDANW